MAVFKLKGSRKATISWKHDEGIVNFKFEFPFSSQFDRREYTNEFDLKTDEGREKLYMVYLRKSLIDIEGLEFELDGKSHGLRDKNGIVNEEFQEIAFDFIKSKSELWDKLLEAKSAEYSSKNSETGETPVPNMVGDPVDVIPATSTESVDSASL